MPRGSPLVALVLVAGVVGVQLAKGAAPSSRCGSADPCVARDVTSEADGIEGLAEGLCFSASTVRPAGWVSLARR